jgi:tetratricopeptide (TPR) repeat protein
MVILGAIARQRRIIASGRAILGGSDVAFGKIGRRRLGTRPAAVAGGGRRSGDRVADRVSDREGRGNLCVLHEGLAEQWRERGGAHPADHCAAVALIEMGRYREAAMRLETLSRAMTRAPASLRAEVLDQAGQAWLLAGEPVQAYAMAGEAVDVQPGDPELRLDRAEAAASAGYFDRAIGDLDIVLKADPNRADALLYRASAYRALYRLDSALADIEAALTRAPDSAPALLERGNIRRLMGNVDGARRDWQRVGEVAPGTQADIAARSNLEHLDGEQKSTPAPPSLPPQ